MCIIKFSTSLKISMSETELKYFDSHTHVQFAAFKNDCREVAERALAQGIGFINVGTQKDTSRRAIETAYEYNGVYAAVGLHPIHTSASFHDAEELGDGEEAKSFTSRGEEFDYAYYKELALKPKVVAIGECGLDFFRVDDKKIKEKQKDIFIQQIKLSGEIKKPLMIHCREAFPDLISTLTTNSQLLNPNNPGIIHFFSGTKEEAKKLLDRGFYCTFGGVITFTHAYDEIIKFIPLDKILSETDAPYVAPVPYRGKRNEPLYVIEVVKKLAEIKNVSIEKMAEEILKNVKQIFSLQF